METDSQQHGQRVDVHAATRTAAAAEGIIGHSQSEEARIDAFEAYRKLSDKKKRVEIAIVD